MKFRHLWFSIVDWFSVPMGFELVSTATTDNRRQVVRVAGVAGVVRATVGKRERAWDPGFRFECRFVTWLGIIPCWTWFTVTYWSVFPNFLEHFALEMKLKLACNKGGWISRCLHTKIKRDQVRHHQEKFANLCQQVFDNLVSESPYTSIFPGYF